MHSLYLPRLVAVFSVLIVTLSACSQNGGADGGIKKEHVGAVVGAIGGAFAGQNLGKGKGRTLGIAAGTILGAYIGSEIGASLDNADMAYHNRTAQYALEETKSGTTSTWRNPDTDHSGSITPTKAYQVADGSYCREFTQTILVGGREQEAYGTACRQADGTWKLQ